MDYKQADSLMSVLTRIAEALEGIDCTLTGIEGALNEMKGENRGQVTAGQRQTR